MDISPTNKNALCKLIGGIVFLRTPQAFLNNNSELSGDIEGTINPNTIPLTVSNNIKSLRVSTMHRPGLAIYPDVPPPPSTP